MKLIKKILGRLNGLYYPQEYLCLSEGSFEQPLSVYLIINGLIVEDITNHHNFVGYSPLIFALSSSPNLSHQTEQITLAFSAKALPLNERFIKKDAVALLIMKKIKEQTTGDKPIFYFEGMNGRHQFLSRFHQFINQLQNRLYQKRPGNVFLPGNLYKQVQIAYSIPRNISLITLRQDGKYNLFPTDLHGPVDENYYIISLRHEGKACAQVMNVKNILVSQVHSDLYKTVYSLGKNHMQDLKEKEKFPLTEQLSSHLQLPIPLSSVICRELELKDHFTHGIHRVMLFKTLYQQELQPRASTLAHIHNAYASWRHINRLKGNYLMR
ncbi:MAG: hypothetical protein HOP10_01320 [Chitinophagaceae bacterium]|nr:hypothetical protein [Chitinophagaceae bacterium]